MRGNHHHVSVLGSSDADTRLVDLDVSWSKHDEAARYRTLLRSSP